MMRSFQSRRTVTSACRGLTSSIPGVMVTASRYAATEAASGNSSAGFQLSDEDKAALGLFTTKKGNLAFQRPARGGWSVNNENAFLHVVRPDLAKEFDEEANPGVAWKSLTMGSRYLATWKCKICTNHYQHEVKDRVKVVHVAAPCPTCKKSLLEQATQGGAEKIKKAADLQRQQDIKDGKPRSALGRRESSRDSDATTPPPAPAGPPEWKVLESKISCWDLMELSQGLVQAARGVLITEYNVIKQRMAAEKKLEEELLKASEKPDAAALDVDPDDVDDPIEKSTAPATVDNPAALAAADPTENIELQSRKENSQMIVIAHEIKKLNNLEALLSRTTGAQNFAQPDSSMAAYGEDTQPLTPESLFSEQECAAITQEFKFQRSLFEMALESAGGNLRSKSYRASADALASVGGHSHLREQTLKSKKVLLSKTQEQRLVTIFKLWADAAELKPDDGMPDDKPLRIRCRVVLLHLAALGRGERCVLEKVIVSRLSSDYEPVKTKEELLANVAHLCLDGAHSDAHLSLAGHTWLYLSNEMAFDVVTMTARKSVRQKALGTSPNPEIQYEPNQGYYYYYDEEWKSYYYSYNGIDYTDEAGNAAPFRDWSVGQQKKVIVATTEEMEKKMAAHKEEKAAQLAKQEEEFKAQQERFAAQQAEYAAQYSGDSQGYGEGTGEQQPQQ